MYPGSILRTVDSTWVWCLPGLILEKLYLIHSHIFTNTQHTSMARWYLISDNCYLTQNVPLNHEGCKGKPLNLCCRAWKVVMLTGNMFKRKYLPGIIYGVSHFWLAIIPNTVIAFLGTLFPPSLYFSGPALLVTLH